MNSKKNPKVIQVLKSKFSIKLWGAMMLLVLFAIAFLWIAQIWLFEPNYINATIDELESYVEQTITELQTEPLSDTLKALSRSVRGRVYLVDGERNVVDAYSSGLSVVVEEVDINHMNFINENLDAVFDGERVKKTMDRRRPGSSLGIGTRVEYREQSYALFVYTSLSEIETLQNLNRDQLFWLSAGMTIVAAAIAFMMAQHLVKPIKKIEKTVDKMAEGDLTAKPGVERSDELGHLSRSVEQLGEALQRVDVLRKEVIANVSHELRSPLAAIKGYGEMVRDINGGDRKKRTENMDLIIRESERMSQMVDDIMDYSQFQAGYIQLNREEVNLYELVKGEVDLVRKAAGGYGVSLELTSYSEEVMARLDSIKISQVLRNLLNNAVNNTANECTIWTSVTNEDGMAKVAVSNPGEEISEKDMEIIWERYQRIQHQGGRREGTGIGLSIVSTILEAHGMEYGIVSQDGWNTFWFTVEVI